MDLYLFEKKYSFENNQSGLEELIHKINNILKDKNVYFSHMVIDDEEVFEGFEEYILENIEKIQQIEVKVKTIEQFINELIVSLNGYADRAIPEIKTLVDQFYQKPTSETWELLNLLLEGIDWTYRTIKSIDQSKDKGSSWDTFINVAATFESELPNLLDAMENQDAILVGDIIQYEILPQFESIHNETEKMFSDMDQK